MITHSMSCPVCKTKEIESSIEFCPKCNWELINISTNSSDGLRRFMDTKLSLHKNFYFSHLNGNNGLNLGEEIQVNNMLTSGNGQYHLILQYDGNLVLYNFEKKSMWSSDTCNKEIVKCIFQNDGNFVLYDINENSVWSTQTQNRNCNRLILEDDGNINIYSDEEIIWSTDSNKASKMNLNRLQHFEFQISNKRYNTYMNCQQSDNKIWQVYVNRLPEDTLNQRWSFKKVRNNNFIIFSLNSFHCLDTFIEDEKPYLHLWPYHGMENQQWKIEQNEDHSYKIFSVSNGLCLDGWREDGIDLFILWEPHNGEHQDWWINPIF